MAVNSFWRARVEMEPLALRDICLATVTALPDIKRAMDSLREMELPLEDESLNEVLTTASSLLTRFLRAPTGKRINYIFATKFLHWCCPAVLPPVDKQAAQSMRRLGATTWVPGPSTVTTEERCIESYRTVTSFYNQALLQLTVSKRQLLQNHDFRTQPMPFRRRNSVVRILDKYFWLEGAEQ